MKKKNLKYLHQFITNIPVFSRFSMFVLNTESVFVKFLFYLLFKFCLILVVSKVGGSFNFSLLDKGSLLQCKINCECFGKKITKAPSTEVLPIKEYQHVNTICIF